MPPKRRLNHCYAPGCKTGYARTSQDRKLSLFKAPADDERRLLWQRHLRRLDKPLDTDCAVCELHFEPRFVLRDYVHVVNGAEVRIPRGTPTLSPDAVPTILPNLPSYLSVKAPTPRPERKRRQTGVPGKNKRRRTDDTSPTSADEAEGAPTQDSENEIGAHCVGLADLRNLTLPSKSWAPHEFPNFSGVSYVACAFDSRTNEIAVERAVFFDCSSSGSVECRVFILGKLVDRCCLTTVREATELLQRAANIPLCCGAAEASFVSASELTKGLNAQIRSREGALFSINCTGRSPNAGLPCVPCKYFRKSLQTRKLRIKRRVLKTTHNSAHKMRASQRKAKRLLSKVKTLSSVVASMKKAAAANAERILQDKLASLSPKQQLAVKQCFKAANRKSTRGMSFDKEWMLECILLKMRSPKLYEYIRRQKILVLPSRTTIRKYLSSYMGSFGFNESMLQTLRKKTSAMDTFKC